MHCVIIYANSGKTTVVAQEKEVKTYKMNNRHYLLTRNYFIHWTSEDFRKTIFILSDKSPFFIDHVLVFQIAVGKVLIWL